MTLAGPTIEPCPEPDANSAEADPDHREHAPRQRGFFCACGNEAIKFNVMQDESTGGVRGWIRLPEEEDSERAAVAVA